MLKIRALFKLLRAKWWVLVTDDTKKYYLNSNSYHGLREFTVNEIKEMDVNPTTE